MKIAKTLLVTLPLVLILLIFSGNPVQARSATKGVPCTAHLKKVQSGATVLKCLRTGGVWHWTLLSAPNYRASDISYLRSVTQWVTDDYAEVECRMQDGIAVSSRMQMLSDNFDRLDDSSLIPPGSQGKYWIPLVRTLRDFLAVGVEMWEQGDEFSGSARFYVSKPKAATMLRMVNKGLGTNYRLYVKYSC